MTINVNQVTFERNGSFGAGYYRIQFALEQGRLAGQPTWQPLQAVMFEAEGHLAVIDQDGQSWRCEDFEDELRTFVEGDTGQQMAFGTWSGMLSANEA